MTFLAAHPWLLILGMALGLPLGMYLQQRREHRARDRERREKLAAEVEFAKRWQNAQDAFNGMFAEARASALT